MRLDREIDLSRGDLIANVGSAPRLVREIEADLCWFDAESLVPGRIYTIKRATTTVRARIEGINWRVDVRTLERVAADRPLAMNDIARVRIQVQQPLAVDAYANNRVTGAFIVIDEASNHTVAAGTIASASAATGDAGDRAARLAA